MDSNVASGFTPLNEFEREMLAARQGEMSQDALIQHLLDSQIVVLLDQDIPDSGWHDDISLMMLNNPSGTPVLAVFTTLERALPWVSAQSAFKYAIHTDCGWLVQRMAPDIGMAVNPGSQLGFELPPAAIDELKDHLGQRLN